MSLDQSIQILFEPHGEKYPRLVVRANGVHDVGRLLAALARGNCEHLDVANGAARELNRTTEGRATLTYLHDCGGPDLTPAPCEPCAEGDHDHCWSSTDPTEAPCGCFEADEADHLRRFS